MAERDSYLQVLSIEVPKTTEWEPERDVMFALSLFSLPDPLSLAIVAGHDNIGWRVIVRPDVVETLTASIFANHRLADVTVKPMKKAPIGYYNFPLQAAAPFSAPMAYFDDFRKVDPLTGVLGAFTNLGEGEALIYQLSMQPATQKQIELGWKTIKTSAAKWWQFLTPFTTGYALTGMALGAKEYPKYVPELQRGAEDKLRANLMQVSFEIKIKAATPQRADEILATLAPGLAAFEREGNNYLVPMQKGAFPLILTANEVAALWHLPNERCDVPGVHWTPAVRSPLTATQSKKKDGVRLGVNQYQGKEARCLVGIPGSGYACKYHWQDQDRQVYPDAQYDPPGYCCRERVSASLIRTWLIG